MSARAHQLQDPCAWILAVHLGSDLAQGCLCVASIRRLNSSVTSHECPLWESAQFLYPKWRKFRGEPLKDNAHLLPMEARRVNCLLLAQQDLFLQPPRNERSKLFHKDQMRNPKKDQIRNLNEGPNEEVNKAETSPVGLDRRRRRLLVWGTSALCPHGKLYHRSAAAASCRRILCNTSSFRCPIVRGKSYMGPK